MKVRYAVMLSVVSSAAIGAAVHNVDAQPKPPTYMIAINEVSNQEGYTKEYLPLAQKAIKEHGGVYVAAGAGTQVTGNLPNGRVVILRWESLEALKNWRESSEYKAALEKGEKFAKYNIIAVPGVAQ